MVSLNTSLSGAGIPLNRRWMISRTGNSYLFQFTGTSALELRPQDDAVSAGNNVVVGFEANDTFAWSLEWGPTIENQILLINTEAGLPAQEAFRYLDINETSSLNNLNLMTSFISKTTNNQDVTWTSGDTSVVTVNSHTGTVTVQGKGAAEIVASHDGVSEKVSYIIIIDAITVSGTPLRYDEDLWNTSGVYYYTNCYAYILNNQIDPVNTAFGYNYTDNNPKQQPGEFYNTNRNTSQEIIVATGYESDPSLLVDAVQKDFEKYNEIFGTNLIFQPIERDQTCPNGTYKVALVISPKTSNGFPDYHWYRQDSSGLWSHKRGTTKIKRVDESEGQRLITDPEIADRDTYSIFVGYFAVSPWNNLYTDISTSSYNFDTQNFYTPVTSNVSIKQVNNIKVGMNLEEVIGILGGVGTDIGSGTVIHQYTTSDGHNVIISYEMDFEGTYVVSGVYNAPISSSKI